MYEIAYQKKAITCSIKHIMTSKPATFLFEMARAHTSVATMVKMSKIVANMRFLSNMILTCLIGPIKKKVDPMASAIPSV